MNSVGKETCRTYYLKILYDAGFDHQLAIPEIFSDSLKKNVVDTVTLKGPSKFTWKVGLTPKDGTLFFSQGWQEFVKENLLEQDDVLLFEYSGLSHFDVRMFDSKSLCEKAAPYFIRQCSEHENCSCKNEESSKNYVCSDCGAKPKSTNIHDTGLQPVIPKASKREKDRKTNSVKPFQIRTISANEYKFRDSGGDFEAKSCRHKEYSETSGSGRRDVTEDEKAKAAKAFSLAESVKTNKGFVVVMKPSHVSKKCAMTIPAEWMHKNLSKEIEDMILSIDGRNWPVKLYYDKLHKRAVVSRGWKHFVLDNDLHEFDVCVFEPAYPTNDSIFLNVNIFLSRNSTNK